MLKVQDLPKEELEGLRFYGFQYEKSDIGSASRMNLFTMEILKFERGSIIGGLRWDPEASTISGLFGELSSIYFKNHPYRDLDHIQPAPEGLEERLIELDDELFKYINKDSIMSELDKIQYTGRANLRISYPDFEERMGGIIFRVGETITIQGDYWSRNRKYNSITKSIFSMSTHAQTTLLSPFSPSISRKTDPGF